MLIPNRLLNHLANRPTISKILIARLIHEVDVFHQMIRSLWFRNDVVIP